jgi:hypothetical protein
MFPTGLSMVTHSKQVKPVVTRGVPVVASCVPVVNSGVPVVPTHWAVVVAGNKTVHDVIHEVAQWSVVRGQ